MDKQPIGVFDSGLGGLTAVKELRRLLPNENIIYFGDTGRVPYGSRSRQTITRYAMEDVSLLLSHRVKAVLSACGTVSAVAGELLRSRCPCPYMEVVSPAAKRACDLSVTGKIGIIATRATIASGKFQSAIKADCPAAEVTAIPCPLFVPLVEEGCIAPDNELLRSAVRLYLTPMRERGVDTLILGCTHYPIIAEAIGEFMGKNVVLVDSGSEAAKSTSRVLLEQGLLEDDGNAGSCKYFVTDSTENFAGVARIFLGGEAEGEVTQVSLEALEAGVLPENGE
ncbi:MAG: glutamate racemase [Angelakisella sp.]